MGQYSPYAIAESKTPEWKPGEELAAAAFVGIAIFIIVDVNIGIWRIFRKAQGMYYWSMKLGTIFCLVDAIGVILKYMTPNPYGYWGLYTTCLLLGWTIYAPAQLLVLYSRLHLVNSSRKVQRYVLVMILSTVLFVIIPTWVVVWPAYDPDPKISSEWSPRDAIVERYNQIAFTLVEIILSGVYIWSLLGLLNLKSSVRQRRVMLDLVYVNLIIVSLDIVVVIMVYLNQTGISHPMQTCSYAVKLKLEFVVLNQLMAVAARGVQRMNFEERRYHHTSAPDPFSAECLEWDRKASEQATKEDKGAQQESHELTQSDSIQITLPSPVLSKQDRGPKGMPNNAKRMSYDDKQSGRDAFGREQEPEPGTFLNVDETDNEAIRHKPSEAFSGSTLDSPGDQDQSPHPFSRRAPQSHNQPRKSIPTPRPHRAQNHDRQHLVPEEQRDMQAPYIARIRKRIPKNARYVHDEEDEEEEIGVHMWENRKGSLVMEVPWFKSRLEGEK